MKGALLRAFAAVLAIAALGCRADPAPSATASTSAPSASSPAPSASIAAPDPLAAAAQACRARRDAARKLPALPGAPGYEALRVPMARVRGRPLLFRRTPAPSAAMETRPGAAKKKVRQLLEKHRKDRAALRRAVLREGYVFSDDVDAALTLVEKLSLPRLFEEPEIWLQRGALVTKLLRKPKDRARFLPERYVFAEGELSGVAAEILHGDRVAPTRAEVEADPLTIDLLDAVEAGGFDRLRPVHLTERALVAEVRYGPDVWVEALFDVEGPRLRPACEVLPAELARKKDAFLAEDAPVRRALRRVRRTVQAEMDERLPFDAPRNGEDSEDGDLRREFDRAYLRGLRTYSVDQRRRHDVYDAQGRPIAPQVCIDFLVDTLERAGGKWYAPMTGNVPAPGRTRGLLDFDALGLQNRRSVASFVKTARAHEDLFEVWDNPTRIPFTERAAFFAQLAKDGDALRPLDLVIIFGMKKGKPHYHSMIVLEQDPVTGVPSLIVSNAGIPREHTLEGIMQYSPKRSIKHRVRLRKPWIDLLAGSAEGGGADAGADAGAGGGP